MALPENSQTVKELSFVSFCAGSSHIVIVCLSFSFYVSLSRVVSVFFIVSQFVILPQNILSLFQFLWVCLQPQHLCQRFWCPHRGRPCSELPRCLFRKPSFHSWFKKKLLKWFCCDSQNHENLHFQHRQHSSMAPETTFRQYVHQAIHHHTTDNAKIFFDSLLMQRWQKSRTTKEEEIGNLGSWETILWPTKGVAVLAQQSVLLFNTWDHFKIDDLIMFLGIGLLTKPGMLVLCFLHNLESFGNNLLIL